MSDQMNDILDRASQAQARGMEAIDRLVEVASPNSVYGQPTTVGEYTLITASEVWAGAGFGFGMGGPESEPAKPEAPQAEVTEAGVPAPVAGGGGGGGGGSAARPVALISVGPDGVQVRPVVDSTKLGLALLAAVGSMFVMFGRMRRG